MGVLDSSYIKALGVKLPGLKKIFLIFSDTLLYMHRPGQFVLIIPYQGSSQSLKAYISGVRYVRGLLVIYIK